jgi:hypothetical protein
MTPQPQTPEQRARELLKNLHCEYDAEKLEAELTTIIRERDELKKDLVSIYGQVMESAPWSESNDMEPVDELACGIGGLIYERDSFQEKAAALDWLEQNWGNYITEQELIDLHSDDTLLSAIQQAMKEEKK